MKAVCKLVKEHKRLQNAQAVVTQQDKLRVAKDIGES